MSTATDRLLAELKRGDVPTIDLGKFVWRPADPIDNITAVPKPKPLPAQAFPLTLLEDKTFAGKGFNVIWRPRGKPPSDPQKQIPLQPPGNLDDVIQMNLTAETTTFSKSMGDVPNRGNRNGVGGNGQNAQEDLLLNGISYIQRVGAFENSKSGQDDLAEPAGIHFEPGCFMFVPSSSNPPQKATLNRMGSIPHGTTINAQGLAPSTKPQTGKPSFPKINIQPFQFNKPSSPIPGFAQLNFLSPSQTPNDDNILPVNLALFSDIGTGKKTISKAIFQNPNQILTNAIADLDVDSFVNFKVTTLSTSDFVGGGTSNIGFLGGTGATPASSVPNNENSHAASMTCEYWIETVGQNITIKANQDAEQLIRVVTKAGIPGPLFVVPPTNTLKTLTQDVTKRVTWTQLQYSQNVTLNFNGISWPHISVATLGEVGRMNVDLTSLGGPTPAPKQGL